MQLLLGVMRLKQRCSPSSVSVASQSCLSGGVACRMLQSLRLLCFVVQASFGPLFAYLPVWELSNDRGIPSFSSWAQSRGMDVTQRKAGFGVSAQPREERDQAMTGSTRSSGRDSADLDLVVPSPEERQSLLEAYKKERETRLTALIGKAKPLHMFC